MSYAVSSALQNAVFNALSGDASLISLVGSAVYDALPSGTLPATYVSLGPEDVRQANDATGIGSVHQITISVVTEVPGFAGAKTVAGTVCDALHNASLSMTRGQLISLQFVRARATKIEQGSGRQIDLTFRARVEDTGA